MRRIFATPILIAGISAAVLPAVDEDPPAPSADRVGFPKGYHEEFTVLRRVNRKEKNQVVTVYGNEPAATIQRAADLPYPYGSVIVMETAGARTDAQGKPLVGAEGYFRTDKVVGLHVMRREKGFGEAYGKNRTGEWEYVEYRPDESYITPPQKSFACAACHLKAGQERDFVYRGRLGADGKE
jgi:Cytochrome P460